MACSEWRQGELLDSDVRAFGDNQIRLRGGHLFIGKVRIESRSEESQAGENGSQPMRDKLPLAVKLLVGVILIATGLYGSWYGLASETLSIPSSLALILISLIVLDGGVLLLLSAFVSDAVVRL
jgi:hypothetical protein